MVIQGVLVMWCGATVPQPCTLLKNYLMLSMHSKVMHSVMLVKMSVHYMYVVKKLTIWGLTSRKLHAT